jgi:hypothetical protein
MTTNTQNPEKPLVCSFQQTLVLATPVKIDLRTFQNLLRLKTIQGIFIDNSQNATGATVSVATGQTIYVPPASQALMPLYMSNDFTMTLTGAGTVTYTLLNFVTPAAVWGVSGSNIPTSGGKVIVTDPIREALIVNGALSASNALYGNADTIVHKRAGNQAYSGIIAAAGTTTIITGNPSFFITDVCCYLSPNSLTTTTVAECTLIGKRTSDGTVLFQLDGTAPTALTSSERGYVLTLSGMSYVGNLAGDSLTLTAAFSPNALTQGGFYYNIFGGTTAIA